MPLRIERIAAKPLQIVHHRAGHTWVLRWKPGQWGGAMAKVQLVQWVKDDSPFDWSDANEMAARVREYEGVS